jgi:hypothetical protein
MKAFAARDHAQELAMSPRGRPRVEFPLGEAVRSAEGAA